MSSIYFLSSFASYTSICFLIIVSSFHKVPLASLTENLTKQIYCADTAAYNNARFMPKIDPLKNLSLNQATETQTAAPTNSITPTMGTLTQTGTLTTTLTSTITSTITTTVVTTITSTVTPTTTIQTETVAQPSFTPTIPQTNSPTPPQATPTPVMIDSQTPTMIISKDTPTITPTLFPLQTLDSLLKEMYGSTELQAIQYEPEKLEMIKNAPARYKENIYRLILLGLMLLIWIILGVWFFFIQKN